MKVIKVKQKKLLNREKLFNKIIKGQDLIGTTLKTELDFLGKTIIVKSRIYKISQVESIIERGTNYSVIELK